MRHPPQCPAPWWRGFNSATDLRNLRKRTGLSQSALAALVGLERHSVLYHERRAGRVDGIAPRMFREAFEAMGVYVPGWREPEVPPLVANGRRQASAGTTCGARTRKGTPCQCKPTGRGGRCKFHGGMSTGPKTPEGKARIIAARQARARAEAQNYVRARDGVSAGEAVSEQYAEARTRNMGFQNGVLFGNQTGEGNASAPKALNAIGQQ